MKTTNQLSKQVSERVLRDEGLQVALSLLLLLAVFLYQVVKARLRFRYDDNLGMPQNLHASGSVAFVVTSALLVAFLPRIARISSRLVLAVVVLVATLVLVSTFTQIRGMDWTGLDVPQDTFLLAMQAQQQGPFAFIATYNDRGNPDGWDLGWPGFEEYAEQVHRLVDRLGLAALGRSKWVGEADNLLGYGRPFMHPPLFFILLGSWMRVFGNTPLSATLFMWISAAVWGCVCFFLLRSLRPRAAVFLTFLFVTLPTSIMYAWYPTYDVLAGMMLFLGYGLFLIAVRQKSRSRVFLGSVVLGSSVMLRLTSLFFVALLFVAFAYVVLRGRRALVELLLHGGGLAVAPLVLRLLGYNPLLTLVTAKVRQDVFYRQTVTSLLTQLPVVLYLGIPLLVLSAFSVYRARKRLFADLANVLALVPLAAAVLLAYATRLSPDFPRTMIGVSGCLLFSMASEVERWPRSPVSQSVLVGANLAFLTLVTVA